MKPVIALVGRPNVGKSTLFNRLTRTRDALVADYPGLTRDRKYGDGRLGDYLYTVVDTGGIGENDDGIDAPMTEQSLMAVGEADLVLFLVDGRHVRHGSNDGPALLLLQGPQRGEEGCARRLCRDGRAKAVARA